MPKCLKCDLDNVPEDHALRCPMRNHVCQPYYTPTNYPYYPWTTSPTWTIDLSPNANHNQTQFYHTTCGSGCNHV